MATWGCQGLGSGQGHCQAAETSEKGQGNKAESRLASEMHAVLLGYY